MSDMWYQKEIIFGEYCEFSYQPIPIADNKCFMYECQADQFYLNIPGIARFLVFPAKNHIIIEKAHSEIEPQMLNNWLFGMVIAYILQYHGYLVLHGSAVLIDNRAVIFSGQSGAGKSTLASALVNKGYPLITDDLVVIKRNEQSGYEILPGPAQLKLWKDAIQYFDYDIQNATPVIMKKSKYVLPVSMHCQSNAIPIAAFYELNISEHAHVCEKIQGVEALKILVRNVYRYFMLEPLGQLSVFFNECKLLAQEISVYKMSRTTHFKDLPGMIEALLRTSTIS
jgi:hypothetical protein